MEGTCLEGTCLEGKGAARARPGGPFPFRPLARPRSYAHSRPSVKVGKVLAENALKAKDVDVVVVGLDVDQAELVVVAGAVYVALPDLGDARAAVAAEGGL